MRAGAGDAAISKPWPVWLVVGAISLTAATAYFCLSIAEAVRTRGEDPIGIIVFSEGAGDTAPPPAPIAQTTVEPRRPPVEPIAGGLSPSVVDADLMLLIEESVGQDAEHIAVTAKHITDGRFASLNGDFQFYAASTFKLAVLYEAERRHFAGELDYADRIFISEEDAAEDLGTSGNLEFEDDGSITIGNLLEAMITVSDNSSAVALLHEFGSAKIDATLRELGVTTMTLNQVELWTTADDLARLMEAIYVGEGVGSDERDHMRDLLQRQSIRFGIPEAVGANRDGNLLVGNKTGTWPGAQHDVAFIEAQSGTYVLAVLTDGSLDGWQALHRVSARIHTAMTKSP